jgi:CheY-like chemotaxis protein
MPDGGRLVVELSNVQLGEDFVATHPGTKAGPYVLLSVSDTGMGMDAETRQRIFEPFYTTKPVGVGTGLGLATVHGIMKMADGSADVFSEPGQGTTFKLHFPRAVGEAPPIESAAEPEPIVGGTETILLVEDDPAVRRFTQRSLQELGYTVLEADAGDAAVEIATTHADQIALLVSDVMMPGMQGPELGRRLRQLRPGLAILYVSGFARSAVINDGVAAGASYLPKPFSRAALAQAVRSTLDAAA